MKDKRQTITTKRWLITSYARLVQSLLGILKLAIQRAMQNYFMLYVTIATLLNLQKSFNIIYENFVLYTQERIYKASKLEFGLSKG